MASKRKHIRIFLLAVLFLSFCSGCIPESAENTIFCEEGDFRCYEQTVSALFPEKQARITAGSEIPFLRKGSAAETFEVTASPILEKGGEAYWYPQYQAAVIIAADISVTGEEIRGWQDLLNIDAPVGVSRSDFKFILAAVSYGLEGDEYSPLSAAGLFKVLNDQNRLRMNDMQAPVVICFDHQAASMAKNGRTLKIIVPYEGTFVYGKGLLSTVPLEFSADADLVLLDAGFRLPDGRCDQSVYPQEQSYSAAGEPKDLPRLYSILENSTRIYKYSILSERQYLAADGRGQHLTVLLFLLAAMEWTGYVHRRMMQKKIRQAAVQSGIFVIGWVLLRAFKWQLPSGTLNRYCWYCYYFFQLGLALLLLKMSWLSDKTDDSVRSPLWLKMCTAANVLLFLLIITNDLHMTVFRLDFSLADTESSYIYGAGYYLTAAVILSEAAAGAVMLSAKSRRSPRKGMHFVPLLLCILLAVYSICYAAQIPFARYSDMTIVVCVFAVLYMESCIQTGLLPVNSKYRDLFSASSMNMQIVTPEGRTVLASANTAPLSSDIWENLVMHGRNPMHSKNSTLTYMNSISGGAAVWQEDISRIDLLQHEIQSSIAKLRTVNAMLKKEEQIKSSLAYAEARTVLFSELESEMKLRTEMLSDMIKKLPDEKDQRFHTAAIVLMLCFIKRRCNLFFRQRETESITSEELKIYFDEFAEFSEYVNVKLFVSVQGSFEISARHAALYYDFLYSVLERAAQTGCGVLIVSILCPDSGSGNEMNILPSDKSACFTPDEKLADSVGKENGEITFKDLDDTTGIRLAFPGKEAAG